MKDVLELEVAAPWLARRVRRPGAVMDLWCRATRGGGLKLVWQPPAGSTPVDGYRIERTRDGKCYEQIGETQEPCFVWPDIPCHDAWFYRVCAFNACGQSSAKWVCFYLRQRPSILQLIPVRPGCKITLCELAVH